MATRLDKLSIEEISGVDAPANDLRGWIVQKAKDDPDFIDRFETGHATLYAALAGVSGDLEYAPGEVRKAAETMGAYVEALMTPEEEQKESLVSKMRALLTRTPKPEPEPEPVAKEEEPAAEEEPAKEEPEAPTGEETDVTKTLESYVRKDALPDFDQFATSEDADAFREVAEVIVERLEAVEKYLSGSDQVEEPAGEPVTKRGGTLQDGILSAIRGSKVELS
jgi:hypothetical protein